MGILEERLATQIKQALHTAHTVYMAESSYGDSAARIVFLINDDLFTIFMLEANSQRKRSVCILDGWHHESGKHIADTAPATWEEGQPMEAPDATSDEKDHIRYVITQYCFSQFELMNEVLALHAADLMPIRR
jgi:hypothetical protein